MKVISIAIKRCHHRRLWEQRLHEMGTPCAVIFIENRPDLMEKYKIHNSPNLVVDNKLLFRGKPGKQLPTQSELKELFQLD